MNCENCGAAVLSEKMHIHKNVCKKRKSESKRATAPKPTLYVKHPDGSFSEAFSNEAPEKP